MSLFETEQVGFLRKILEKSCLQDKLHSLWTVRLSLLALGGGVFHVDNILVSLVETLGRGEGNIIFGAFAFQNAVQINLAGSFDSVDGRGGSAKNVLRMKDGRPPSLRAKACTTSAEMPAFMAPSTPQPLSCTAASAGWWRMAGNKPPHLRQARAPSRRVFNQ